MNTISPLFTFITANPITSYLSYSLPLIFYTCNRDLKSYDNYHEKLWYMSINTFLITTNPITHIFILNDVYNDMFSKKKTIFSDYTLNKKNK